MAFNNNTGKQSFIASAGQTAFAFNFKIYADTDMEVYQNDTLLTLTTHYAVVIDGDDGGTVTLVTGASVDDDIVLIRNLPKTRTIDYQSGGDFLEATIDEDQDYQTYLLKDLAIESDSSLHLPLSVTGVDTELPVPVALTFFQWNAAANALQMVNSLQADGYLWTAADVYTKTEVNAITGDKTSLTTVDKSSLVAAANELVVYQQSTTHNITSDADYSLTSAQNRYGQIAITDTGVVLTAARNITVDTVERIIIAQNSTLQDLTFKTSGGSGIKVTAGAIAVLRCDGTNVVLVNRLTPIEYYGYLSANVTTGATILSWTNITDSDGAMSAGLYTAPEDGWYLLTSSMMSRHTDGTSTAVTTDMYVNAAIVKSVQNRATSAGQFQNGGFTIPMYLNAGDVVKTLSNIASATHFIQGGAATNAYTYFAVAKIGE